MKEPKFHKVEVGAEPVEIQERRARRGRPAKDETPPEVQIRHRLVARSIELDDEAIALARSYAKFFVLVTDHLNTETWPDTRVLGEYRHQHLIEGHTGFRWLKGPAAAAPMFLNTPTRIAALGLVFVLALMVRNYIEFATRDRLAAMPPKVALPNMDRRPTRKPSTENVFWLFRRVNVTAIRHMGVLIERRVSGFDVATDLALTLLQVPPAAFTVPPKRLEGLRRS